jgi:hypothetical protein
MGDESLLGERSATRRSSFTFPSTSDHPPSHSRLSAMEALLSSPTDVSSDDEASSQLHSQTQRTELTTAPALPNQRFQHAVPVSISGITGSYASFMNGIYLPTSLVQNGWPIYRRVGDSTTSSDSTSTGPVELRDLSLCFHVPPSASASSTLPPEQRVKAGKVAIPSNERLAWIIRNSEGVVYARCRLTNDANQSNIPPERIQFHDHGIRKDICWEMRSSVEVFGFRKRSGGVMRPASFFQLKSLPQLAEEIFEMTRSLPISELPFCDADPGARAEAQCTIEAENEAEKPSNSILRGRVSEQETAIISQINFP